MKKMIALVLVLSFSIAASAQQKIDVAVKQVNDRRSKGFFAELVISLELPKIQSSEVAASRVLVSAAVDETGRDLIDREAQEPRLEPNQRLGMKGPPMPAQVSLTLKNPDRRATKVKEVRGEIELFMPAKDANSVAEIAKFVTMSGKALSHKALKANGVEISLLTAAQVDAEKKRRAEEKRKEYTEAGYDGESIATMITSLLESLLTIEENELVVRVKDPNKRIQQINYVDAAGEVKQVMMREDEGLVRLSTWEGKPQPDWKLRVSMQTPKNTARYAFALNDIPLP
ncbi:MAG TPA: hypothetical protein VNA69_18590 [Thermoanaerobaculia bacterium]|nr:hypothetical protein [Thermoanaerobaculia bacterium]